MKIPKYWARSGTVERNPGGRVFNLACWQWSDESVEQARQRAQQRVGEIARKVRAGEELNRYGYCDRALREPTVQSIESRSGIELGKVTRNQYGALVLNATQALFADVDFPEEGAGASLGGRLLRLFGAATSGPEAACVERISAWAQHNPQINIRIYRTFAGLRCLIANRRYDPDRNEALDILRALGSDPLYVRLCQAQECFRARLTPKPWRCNLSVPPARFPFETDREQQRFRDWERQYTQTIAAYSVCRLVKEIGPKDIDPDIAPILDLHDKSTGIEGARQLA